MGSVFDPQDIMIYIQLDKKFDWLGLTHGLIYPISNGLGQNRETDEEHKKHCVGEEFQFASVKFDRDGDGGSKALAVANCSINI